MTATARKVTRLLPVQAALVLLLAAGPVFAQHPKYGVKVAFDKKAHFANLRSYAWQSGWKSYDPKVDAHITLAVDRELAALGLVKSSAGPSDVTISYATLQRTDVNLKAKRGLNGSRPTYPVGSLVVIMRDESSQQELFRGRVDTPIKIDYDVLEKTIDDQVSQIFARYPTRHH